MTIYLDDIDYRWFSYLLGDVLDRFAVECWHYCLMPNHYHAALRPTAPNLSEAVRQLNSRYAQWWNRRHKRVGHVFQGRFKDQVVQQDGYLLTLGRYIARNPVKAELVERPEDWKWSSYSATAGLKPPPSFLFSDVVLNQYGDADRAVLQSRFVSHVCSDDDDDGRCLEDQIRSDERILGSQAFKKAIEEGQHRNEESGAGPSEAPEGPAKPGSDPLD
jgi:REP element-mobilizing transposase RayT